MNHLMSEWVTRLFVGQPRLHRVCQRHEERHWPEVPRVCVQCKEIFQTLSAFNNHKKSHKRIIIISCTVCQKNFRNSSSFKKHFSSHEPERHKLSKKYKTDICNPHCNWWQKHIYSHQTRSRKWINEMYILYFSLYHLSFPFCNK